jgi:hemerythrin-like domain-containing protein
MAETINPIVRNESLKNLSRDHHFGLLFCWKIRSSLNTIETKRLARYSEYFYKEHLQPHFKLEEKYIFPLFGEETTLVQEAMDDHMKLTELFGAQEKSIEILAQIAKTLEKHIRFEERVLFKELQKLIPEDELAAALGQSLGKPEEDTWEDKFWERKSK